jgi:hypothetical protein
MGLLFTISAGPRQRIHSRVRVPCDWRPYFTVSDLRLPFLSPPPTRRATVEVFDPASTREISLSVKVILRLTVGLSVRLCVQPHLGLMTRSLLLLDSYNLVFVVRPLWREDAPIFCICFWPLPAHSFSGPSPAGLMTTYYCLTFETLPTSSPGPRNYTHQEQGGPGTPHVISYLHYNLSANRVEITSSNSRVTAFERCCTFYVSLPWISVQQFTLYSVYWNPSNLVLVLLTAELLRSSVAVQFTFRCRGYLFSSSLYTACIETLVT